MVSLSESKLKVQFTFQSALLVVVQNTKIFCMLESFRISDCIYVYSLWHLSPILGAENVEKYLENAL